MPMKVGMQSSAFIALVIQKMLDMFALIPAMTLSSLNKDIAIALAGDGIGAIAMDIEP